MIRPRSWLRLRLPEGVQLRRLADDISLGRQASRDGGHDLDWAGRAYTVATSWQPRGKHRRIAVALALGVLRRGGGKRGQV